MFQGLREGSLFYVLNKSGKPTLRVGQVVSVSNPQPKFGQFGPMGGDTTVDITIKVNDETLDFKQLPSGLSIANFWNGVVVSESREAMNAEVESMCMTSKKVLDSIAYHQDVVASCDAIKMELNPQFAKDKANEEKIGSLENKIEGMEATLNSISSMLSLALDKKSKE